MTRIPDRTFQAAAREALLARVEQPDAVPRSATTPSRERLRTAFATLLVIGVVATAWLVLAGVQAGRPVAPRPIGAASTSTSSPAPPSSTPSPDPAPTTTRGTPAPTTQGSPAPTTPDTPPAPRLITPAGWHEVTRAELHAFVLAKQISSDDPANQAIWEQETWTDVRCMAAKGFVYDPVDQWNEDSTTTTGVRSLTTDQQQAYDVALYGPPSVAPYDWRKAGCHGASVHLAGQDHAN